VCLGGKIGTGVSSYSNILGVCSVARIVSFPKGSVSFIVRCFLFSLRSDERVVMVRGAAVDFFFFRVRSPSGSLSRLR
jgi:hypothetical protein